MIVRNNGSNTASVTGGMFFQKCNQLTLIGCQSVDNNAGSAAPRQVFISTSSNVRMSGCITDAGTANYAALEVDNTCSALQFSGNMFKRQTSGTAVILSATNGFFGKGQLVGANTISNRGTGNRVEPVVVLTKTADYLATVSDRLIRVDASAGNVVITLPGVVAYGLEAFRVKKIDASANTVTIQCAGAETMDGTNSKVIGTQYGGIAFESNNVTWDVV